MKVMYFLHEGGKYFNGASFCIVDVIRASAAAGNESYVVIPRAGGRLQAELEQIPNTHILVERMFRWKDFRRKNPFRQFCVWLRFLLVRDAINRRTARRLADFAKEHQIDLLHTNSSVLSLGGLVQKYTGLPHVWHFREFGEEISLYPYMSQRAFYRFVEQHSDRVVCVSQAVCNKVRGYLRSPEKAMVIYDGVEIGQTLPAKEMPKDRWKLLISGAISRNKGQWVAVEALQKLLQKGCNAELYLAGLGDPELLGPAYEAVKEHVHLLGFVNDMAALRAKVDIELSCSVSEGFGRTTVEAMSAGNISIGSNCSATPELIEDGKTGFLFRVNDPEDLTQKLEAAMQLTPEEWSAMRQNAFDSVRARFQKSINSEAILRLYQQLIANKKE